MLQIFQVLLHIFGLCHVHPLIFLFLFADVMVKSCNPVVFSFYNYLRTHPLIIRRHFANPDGTATTVGLTAEKSSADEINLIERKLFFTTANAHFKVSTSLLWFLSPGQLSLKFWDLFSGFLLQSENIINIRKNGKNVPVPLGGLPSSGFGSALQNSQDNQKM